MSTPEEIARAFHATLIKRDWDGLRSLLTDDVTWTLPGQNMISGRAEGIDAVVDRARLIASYGPSFSLEHVLIGPRDMALGIHNTAERNGLRLDEHLATVCRLQGNRIREIETFLSDLDGMNRFFAAPPTARIEDGHSGSAPPGG